MTAAEPTGDVREQIARLVELHGITDTPNGELFADRLDDTIRRALEEMRDALAAQETVRRGRAEHQPTAAVDVGPGGEYPRDMCTCGESFYDDCQVRRLLDGETP